MEIISSVQNPLIKETKKLQQKKYRERQSLFLVEGVRLAEEGLKAGSLRGVFYEQGILTNVRGQELMFGLERLLEEGGLEYCLPVTAPVLQNLAETQTPQGIIAVAAKKQASLAALAEYRDTGLLLIADGVSDPGNLGTIIRTAQAAGAEAIICLAKTADCYNAKTIRATMGAVFTMPLIIGEEWSVVEKWCRDNKYQLVAGDLNAYIDYFSCDYEQKVALIIGNEGQGLSVVSPSEVDLRVRIPLENGVESLNAAVAGGLLLYEVVRQRRNI